MNKKKVFLWSLYDFANSIAMIVFFLYYSQWIVIDKGVSDFWFNMSFVGSSVLLLLTAPVAGAISDKIKVKMPGLKITTLLSSLFFLATGINASFFPEHHIVSLFLFTLATYFYLFCFVFYNALITDVAHPSKHGTVSGWGIFSNYAGQITGLLVTLPLATGAVVLWGEPGRAQPLIPAAILFLLLALPTILFFKEESVREKVSISIGGEYKKVISSFKSLIGAPGLGTFFLAYFLFNDALITASNNFPIYLEKVLSISDTVKTFLLILIMLTSAIGAIIGGWVTDRVGHKRSLIGVLLGWVITYAGMIISTNFIWFAIFSGMMGLFFGATWAVTRALVTQLTPPDALNQSFTYYTLMERFATFVGPITWGLIVTIPFRAPGTSYRLAAASMCLFVIVGLYIAKKIPEKNLAV
ncbi:MFS transporter [Patescibacteria group bacterium]|nr:MAG: MFS transporter [Patescibacteria group bacterium]